MQWLTTNKNNLSRMEKSSCIFRNHFFQLQFFSINHLRIFLFITLVILMKMAIKYSMPAIHY